MAFVYSSVNVMNRMLKGVHFAVIGIYHALFGTAFALVFISSTGFSTGTFPISVHGTRVYLLIVLTWVFDFT